MSIPYVRVTDVLRREPSYGWEFGELGKFRTDFYTREQRRERGAIRGTQLHEYICTCLSSNQVIDLPPNLKPYSESLNDVIRYTKKLNLLAVESLLTSTQYRYRGVVDCVAQRGRDVLLIDWKSSDRAIGSDSLSDYYLQLAAYSQAISEQHGFRVDKGIVVVFRPNRKAESYCLDASELNQHLETFLKRLDTYRAWQEKKAKKG